ncbi:sortase family protein [Streptomyces sp. KhCrAH-43]|uniref:class F sortase n=1 Tax=Streptomyces TaxID=1883 RepID=UPI000379C2FE|nr:MULTISPECIES: class F sortase [unclassified Streptomyces]MYS39012.1 class F sortase [Streptomyces sp. SID4920]MYX68492.1 class F sortase [Streptomyces sp. SID8373]RAJ49554.1 sortase family protein [Streptomyces sp. KhCrAH-43]
MNGSGFDDEVPTSLRRRRFVLTAAIMVLLLAGALMLGLGIDRQHPAPPAAEDKAGIPRAAAGRTAVPDGKASGSAGGEQGTTVLPASRPLSITIPAIKVASGLEDLALGKGRAMETPRDPDKAGWYTPGPTPGALGPSVIAGHVTWNGAPGVFFKLAELDPGDRIDVRRADGSTATFTVDRTAVYPKDRFPTVEVYRNLDHAGLRLITCGGDYSASDSHYADNVVVYATLTDSHT